MLAAALGKELPAAGRPAAERRKKVGTAARNAVVAEAYDESEAHAAAAGKGSRHGSNVPRGVGCGCLPCQAVLLGSYG